jgi:hypothetical protein
MAWLFEYTWHVILGEPVEYTLTKEEYVKQRFLPDLSTEELVIVSAHYWEDLQWLENSEFPVIVSTNNPTYKVAENSKLFVDERLRAPMNSGREASAYMRFIVEYYDRLPEYVAFIHGHEHAWHQLYPGGILKAIRDAKKKEYDYISINTCRIINLLNPGNPYWETTRSIWPEYFETIVGKSIPERIHDMECSAQFIVRKRQILKYPLHVWKRWLEITQFPGHVSDYHFQNMAWVFEYSWYIIFGENEWEYSISTEEYRIQRFAS